MSESSGIVSDITWGIVEMTDGTACKDVIVKGDKYEIWDWSINDMHHDPGVRIIDIEEYLKDNAKIVIITRGYDGRLLITAELLDHLHTHGIQFIVCMTNKFLDLYKTQCKIYGTAGVLAFIHSTC